MTSQESDNFFYNNYFFSKGGVNRRPFLFELIFKFYKMSKSTLIGDKEVSTIGRFRLDITGNKKRFAMTNLFSFVPYGKTAEDRVYFSSPTGLVDHYLIDKPSVSFKPDENEIDRANVTVLIQHHDVRIAQMPIEDHQKLVRLKLKSSNPKFILTNIDKVEDDTYDRENELIMARATLRSRDKKLSKNKLIWLCSKFGISFRSEIQDSERYYQFLVRQIDQFLMKGNEHYPKTQAAIEAFNDALSNIARTEYIYYINELKNLQMIVDIGGMYKIGERPVGADYDSLINYYEQNQELYMEHKKLVQNSMRGTIME